MKELLRLVAVLTLISAAAGVLLAFTSRVTTEPIKIARDKEKNEALRVVLPDFDNRPAETTHVVAANGVNWTFYVARKAGKFVGAAFEATSNKGYGGELRLLVGVTADNTLGGIEVLAQQETPGLGTKMNEPPFKHQFDGRPLDGTTWAVKKDGGSFDAITGATISSRAVLEAIRGGLAVYTKHAQEIAGTGE